MPEILFFDLNIFMIIFLLFFLITISIRRETVDLKGKLFRYIIIGIITMLSLEILSWIFDGKAEKINYILNFSINSIFTLLSTVVASLWLSYADYMLFQDEERIKKRIFYMYPSIIIFVLITINIFYPILFIINDSNIYSRLPFISIIYLMVILMYSYIFIKVYKRKEDLSNSIINGFLIFLLLPLIAGLFQLFNYGLLITWPATGLALILSYIVIETNSKETDFLTGASSRKKVEDCIKLFIDKGKRFTVIMIDIDDFKNLNDTYGHNEGDKALITMAKTLKRVFDTKEIVSRFGGDEFLVVTDVIDYQTLKFYKKIIYDILKNSENKHISEMVFSYGFASWLGTEKYTMDELIIKADTHMYFDKDRNKKEKQNS